MEHQTDTPTSGEKPQCDYFGQCGGCLFQHVPYTQQILQKKDALVHATKFPDPLVFSGQPYSYRNRMDFIFHPLGLGLRERRNWKHIIDIQTCSISDPRINLLLTELALHFKRGDTFDIHKHTGTFRYAVIRVTNTDLCVSFVLNESSKLLGEAIEKIKTFSTVTTATHVIVTRVPPLTEQSVGDDFFVVKGSDLLCET